jgi:phage/plasmid-associated DNA primase
MNGYLDITDKKFYKREKPNYVLECIDRKYKKAKTKNIEYVLNILKQIYPKDENREQMFRVIGCAFSGQIIDERFSLFLLGKTQAGKSVLMKMLYSAFTKSYVMEFQSDFFDKGSKTVNKTLNQFMKSPNIRISWVNELKNSAVDTSFFKKFCEGAMQTTSLYKDGINDVRHNSVAVITANELPNMHQDTGVKSRIKALKHSSYFTEIKEDIDEAKHIYHRDNQLQEKYQKIKGY